MGFWRFNFAELFFSSYFSTEKNVLSPNLLILTHRFSASTVSIRYRAEFQHYNVQGTRYQMEKALPCRLEGPLLQLEGIHGQVLELNPDVITRTQDLECENKRLAGDWCENCHRIKANGWRCLTSIGDLKIGIRSSYCSWQTTVCG